MHISLSRIGWALLFGASCWGNRSPILLSSMLTIWPRYGSCLAATAGPPPVSGVSTFNRVDLGLSGTRVRSGCLASGDAICNPISTRKLRTILLAACKERSHARSHAS